MKESNQIPHKKIYQLAVRPTVRFSIAGKAKQEAFALCQNVGITSKAEF